MHGSLGCMRLLEPPPFDRFCKCVELGAYSSITIPVQSHASRDARMQVRG
jgi:hypothetical protein